MRSDTICGPKTFQERAARCAPYLKFNIGYADYAAGTTNNTAVDVSLYTLPAMCGIVAVQYRRISNWDGTSNTSVPLQIGDSGSVARNLSSTEMCDDGTEVLLKYEVTSTGGLVSATAATTVNARLAAVSSEKPSTLTSGSTDLHLFVVDFGIMAEGSSEEDSAT